MAELKKTKSLLSSPGFVPAGEIFVCGDKSISHRALILAAISQGLTTISGLLLGQDCLNTLKILQTLGVEFSFDYNARYSQQFDFRSSANKRNKGLYTKYMTEGEPVCHNAENPNVKIIVTIEGLGKNGFMPPVQPLDCGNSATTLRLLAGLLAAQSFCSLLQGDNSLSKRPMARIIEPLTKMGALIVAVKNCPPLLIKGQRLNAKSYKLPVPSAQVKSCILLAGLYAENGDTTVIEPIITRNHTELMLKSFAYPIKRIKNKIVINAEGEGKATYIKVPGDFSAAAFFIVAATLIPNAKILLKNIGVNPTRLGLLHILLKMGANIQIVNKQFYNEEPVADLLIKYAPLTGIKITAELVALSIDEVPVIFIAAACASGQTIIEGAKELRYKESDRINSMVSGLQKLGIKVTALEDGAIIEGGKLQGGEVDSFGDHRIAMAFAIAGTVAEAEVKILNTTNIETSFPNFVALSRQINLMIKEINGN